MRRPLSSHLSRHRCLRLSVVLAGLLLLQFCVLKGLSYSSCIIFAADPTEVGLAGTPDFQIGRITWPVSELARSDVLAPFRVDFQKHCDGKRGVLAALCISARMVKAFPWGSPQRDFYSRNFDPLADFDDHVNRGQPGHCVTRSGILVTELLSAGIPARVVQVFNSDGLGHNISEVWDQELGWVLVDPSYGGTIVLDGRPVSAVAALASPGGLRVSGDVPFAIDGSRYYTRGLQGGTFLYPSPWRYLRTGPRATTWPFLGRFARIGANALRYGGAQLALRTGIVISSILFLASLGFALRPLRRRVLERPRRHESEGLSVSVGGHWVPDRRTLRAGSAEEIG